MVQKVKYSWTKYFREAKRQAVLVIFARPNWLQPLVQCSTLLSILTSIENKVIMHVDRTMALTVMLPSSKASDSIDSRLARYLIIEITKPQRAPNGTFTLASNWLPQTQIRLRRNTRDVSIYFCCWRLFSLPACLCATLELLLLHRTVLERSSFSTFFPHGFYCDLMPALAERCALKLSSPRRLKTVFAVGSFGSQTRHNCTEHLYATLTACRGRTFFFLSKWASKWADDRRWTSERGWFCDAKVVLVQPSVVTRYE